MKKIYLLLCFFVLIFTSCDTDFDVNANWEEVTVVYGLLDSGIGKETQQIKISKAFLGKMDALQMAQYADSINFDSGELAVKVIRLKNNGDSDTIILDEVPTTRSSGIFNNSIMMYTFENEDKFLSDKLSTSENYEYVLLVKNNITGNEVSSTTNIISGFSFDRPNYKFAFRSPNTPEFSNTSIRWGNSTDNGQQYQIDLIFNYEENNIARSLIYTTSVLGGTSQYEFDGEQFFNFLKNELKDTLVTRQFIDIDLVMTVGSEDLKTYRLINEEITGIVLERPQFTNINNGIGLFSSRFTKKYIGLEFTTSTIEYLISIDGLDRNFIE